MTEFCKFTPPKEKYPQLTSDVNKMIAVLGSTYKCEEIYSKIISANAMYGSRH